MADWFYIFYCTIIFNILTELKKADGVILLQHSLKNNYVFHKPCDVSQSYSAVFGQSLEKCILECQYQSGCHVLMFSHRMKQCAYFDHFVTNKTFVKSNPMCLYIAFDKVSGNDSLVRDPECGPLEKLDIMKNLCVNSRCPLPNNIKHSVLLFTSTSIGMSARYKCVTGFYGKGNPQIICQPNATWSFTNFSCISTTCPGHITVENADPLESEPTKVGSSVKYICKPGFYSLGIPEIYCQLNASWMPPNFYCTDKKCPPEQNIDGAFVYSTGQFIGATSHYECSQGYLALGHPEINCLENATWTPTNFTCEKLCPAPMPVENAELLAVEFKDNGTLFREGTQLHYSCNFDHYGESNTATNVCIHGGFWSPDGVVCCKNGTFSDGNKCFQSFPVHSGATFSGKLYSYLYMS